MRAALGEELHGRATPTPRVSSLCFRAAGAFLERACVRCSHTVKNGVLPPRVLLRDGRCPAGQRPSRAPPCHCRHCRHCHASASHASVPAQRCCCCCGRGGTGIGGGAAQPPAITRRAVTARRGRHRWSCRSRVGARRAAHADRRQEQGRCGLHLRRRLGAHPPTQQQQQQ